MGLILFARYTWSTIFSTLLVAAANIATYWQAINSSKIWQIFLFYIICPLIMGIVNCFGVKVSPLLSHPAMLGAKLIGCYLAHSILAGWREYLASSNSFLSLSEWYISLLHQLEVSLPKAAGEFWHAD
jgi:hypothetical protein